MNEKVKWTAEEVQKWVVPLKYDAKQFAGMGDAHDARVELASMMESFASILREREQNAEVSDAEVEAAINGWFGDPDYATLQEMEDGGCGDWIPRMRRALRAARNAGGSE